MIISVPSWSSVLTMISSSFSSIMIQHRKSLHWHSTGKIEAIWFGMRRWWLSAVKGRVFTIRHCGLRMIIRIEQVKLTNRQIQMYVINVFLCYSLLVNEWWVIFQVFPFNSSIETSLVWHLRHHRHFLSCLLFKTRPIPLPLCFLHHLPDPTYVDGIIPQLPLRKRPRYCITCNDLL